MTRRNIRPPQASVEATAMLLNSAAVTYYYTQGWAGALEAVAAGNCVIMLFARKEDGLFHFCKQQLFFFGGG